MSKQVIATYTSTSIFDIEEYGLDLEIVYDYYVKWDELIVTVKEGDEPIIISATFSAEDDHESTKYPTKLERS